MAAVVKALAIAAAAGALLAAVVGTLSIIEHLDARSDWRAMRDRLVEGTSGYDAATSDALHARAESALERTELASLGVGIAVGSLLLALASLERPGPSRLPAPPGRILLATLADGSLWAVAGLLPSVLAGPLGSAWSEVVWRLVCPLVAGAAAAALRRGATPGQRMLGLATRTASGDAPGALRALLAIALLPLAVPIALVLTPVLRRPAVAAPHLAGLGVFVRG